MNMVEKNNVMDEIFIFLLVYFYFIIFIVVFFIVRFLIYIDNF